MRLAAGSKRFELRIVGYQFPANATAEYDSDWLVVEVRIGHPRGDWRFSRTARASYALWSPSLGSRMVRKASQCHPARVSVRRS